MTHENFPNWEKTITDEIIKFEKNNQLFTELKPVASRPSMYTVSLLNDDFTPMDFVVHLLERIFHKSHEDALRVMLKVHTQGEAVCGTYTREVAETIVGEVMDTARAYHYPLKCIMCKDHEYVVKKSGS